MTEQAAAFPEFKLNAMATDKLAPRDAAFAHAIEAAVMRRWITLVYILQTTLRRPFESLDPRVQAALLAGAGQMMFMDKVPARAAIFEAVEWAKRAAKPEVGSLVNASLRSLGRLLERAGGAVPAGTEEPRTFRETWTNLRDEVPLAHGGSLIFAASILPEDPVERAAIATGHAVPLVKRWAHFFGDAEAIRLAHHGIFEPPVILNTHYADPAEGGTATLRPVASPHDTPGAAVYVGPGHELTSVLEHRPDIWVQDTASTAVVEGFKKFLKERNESAPSIILDLCAGQGTKSRHLIHAFRGARVVATDIDERRFKALQELASKNPGLEAVPPASMAADTSEFVAKADLVLLDVPCSNSGVLARRPEAKARFDAAQMQRLTAIQRDILTNAARLVRPPSAAGPGGFILYATCSIEHEEDEHQGAWARSLGLRLEREHRTKPVGIPGEPAEKYGDGSYWAILRKI